MCSLVKLRSDPDFKSASATARVNVDEQPTTAEAIGIMSIPTRG